MSLLREAEKCIANQKLFTELNAFITPLQSLGSYADRIRDADVRRENGTLKSPLDGRLIAIKDNICTRSLPTTCASRMLEKFTSPFDATVINSLENAGAIIGGKTNLDEFGMGSHSTHSHFGPVKNYFDIVNGDGSERSLSAGGSSGGSAVAVATDQCYAALGTDTGGSVRLPAAYTGIVGFKPSYGLISRWGVIAYANSLDTVGILAKRTSIVREVFNILNHHDARDPTNLSTSTRSRIATAVSQLHSSSRLSSRPLRIGVPIEYNLTEMTSDVRKVWLSTLQTLEKQGHTLHPISLPSTKHALSAYYILAPAEASSNLAKYDGIRYGTRAEGPDKGEEPNDYLYARTRGEGFGDEVRRRILLGSFSLSADAMDNYFIQAQRVRRLVQNDFDNVFALKNPLGDDAEVENRAPSPAETKVDVIIGPTTASLPPSLASVTEDQDSAVSAPLHSYVTDVCTVPASLAGLPAISVPVPAPTGKSLGDGKTGFDKVGIQIIGQYGDDNLVLRVAELLEVN
ncbi:glutamyl-tRNA amidotransferase, A subunit, putative [Talaromyces stipitatus ATCC 10500]|uniref:Glutamyl-tRNA(Gln) amidotransferase subunit A, mitochondrial n=1 Tax=Talaromyces stipitatus (strain ATCC 10500 / CBS 375.48 / QM 6759 / NRRL 1006) TaxID=441959 RepID=B8MNW5_TALSN|nr:glutamyl-tRNA amidotransferase, A subunit, putative [Talaromyces stipitatus ATCC 10500]EED14204.1 glutamyl-tRNA amidotransferase, A subunit, putative [Talaromyces stipitatus ATCC 10500]